MPIRFTMHQVEKLLNHFNMVPQGKKSKLYCGIGNDGVWRTCKFDYHHGRDIVATGTAKSIAISLKFADVAEMKDYYDNNL